MESGWKEFGLRINFASAMHYALECSSLSKVKPIKIVNINCKNLSL